MVCLLPHDLLIPHDVIVIDDEEWSPLRQMPGAPFKKATSRLYPVVMALPPYREAGDFESRD